MNFSNNWLFGSLHHASLTALLKKYQYIVLPGGILSQFHCRINGTPTVYKKIKMVALSFWEIILLTN